MATLLKFNQKFENPKLNTLTFLANLGKMATVRWELSCCGSELMANNRYSAHSVRALTATNILNIMLVVGLNNANYNIMVKGVKERMKREEISVQPAFRQLNA